MKIEEIDGRVVLTAGEGMRVTNGADICGKKVLLAAGLSAEGFYEITEEEYEAMREKAEEDVLC